MELSTHTLETISESLAFYYLEAQRSELTYKQEEIAAAVREIMDYQAERNLTKPNKNPL